MLERVDHLISRGQLDQALELIDTFNVHQDLLGKILTSRIYEMQGKYQQAFDKAAEALAISLDEGRQLEELGARIALGYALVRLRRFDETEVAINQSMELIATVPLDQYRQLKRYEATLYNLQGLLYRYCGHLDKAEDAYLHSLELRSKLDIRHDVAISLTNIGTIYRIKGELEMAIKYHQEAKTIFDEEGNSQFLAFCLHDLGTIYWELDQLDQARQNYQDALSIRLTSDHSENTAYTLFDLIHLNIEFNDLTQAEYYFDMLKELHEEDTSVSVYLQLAQALMLRTSPRLVNRAKAQEIFHNLLQQSLTVDQQAIVYLNLCDLYLLDLKLSRDEDLIEDVQEMVSKLHKLAKSQYSPTLMIETLLIQAKLFLVKLDLETAQQLLFQAEIRANEKNLTNLALKISDEHDKLIDKLYRWDYLKRRNASIIERMEEVDLSSTLDSILTRRHSQVQNRQLEEPLFLLIMNDDAIPIYTTKFDDTVRINQDLIGSFLLASDMGMGMALHDSGSIERIKYGEYTLIFIHHDHLVFCYGYQGQSYFAIKRLQDFIDRIKLGRSWQLLRADIVKPKKIEYDLTPKVHDYFSVDGIYSKHLLE